MKVLDLFCGLKGFSRPFVDRGHEVITLDYDAGFSPDYVIDIFDVTDLNDLGGPFDFILASPPCECFSVASIGAHWTGGWRSYTPKTEQAQQALFLVEHTFKLLNAAQPTFYVVENPRGVMRKIAPEGVAATVWYCRLGEDRAKPTDLWGRLPSVRLPAPCRNGSDDHEAAPRGAKTGTQGIKGAAARAKVAYGLGLTLCLGAEFELGAWVA